LDRSTLGRRRPADDAVFAASAGAAFSREIAYE